MFSLHAVLLYSSFDHCIQLQSQVICCLQTAFRTYILSASRGWNCLSLMTLTKPWNCPIGQITCQHTPATAKYVHLGKSSEPMTAPQVIATHTCFHPTTLSLSSPAAHTWWEWYSFITYIVYFSLSWSHWELLESYLIYMAASLRVFGRKNGSNANWETIPQLVIWCNISTAHLFLSSPRWLQG